MFRLSFAPLLDEVQGLTSIQYICDGMPRTRRDQCKCESDDVDGQKSKVW